MKRDITKEIKNKMTLNEVDELFVEAVRIVCQYKTASASLLQRRLKIGYARAARIIDELEAAKVVSEGVGEEPRSVLIQDPKEVLEFDWDALGDAETTSITVELSQIPPLDILPDDSGFKKISFLSKLQNKEHELLVGKVNGEPLFVSLEEIGNLLIVGNLQSGKEYLLDTLILSLLFEKSSSKTQFIFADRYYDLRFYEKLPHLIAPIINDRDRFVSAVKWILAEIERRNKLFSNAETRSFESYKQSLKFFPRSNYNRKAVLPRIVFVVRNVEDFLHMEGKWFEEELRFVISAGNKVGVHVILVTDKLSAKNVPVAIQSNIPTRIVFQTTSLADSKLAGAVGAEKLPPKTKSIMKLSGKEQFEVENSFITEEEIKDAVFYISTKKEMATN